MSTSKESSISVFLVDDHVVIRESLATMLSFDRRFVVVGHASNGSEALTQLSKLQADVILLDLRLPGEDGFAVLKEILRRTPHVAVLILSVNAHPHDVAQARELGAAGYVTKSVNREQLFAAIGRLSRGGQCWEWVAPPLDGSEHRLTRRELEVLDSLRLGRSNHDIGRSIGISEHTVKSHVKTLFAKLEVGNRGEAVARGFELGLLT